jgi:uncharacterized membrane protein
MQHIYNSIGREIVLRCQYKRVRNGHVPNKYHILKKKMFSWLIMAWTLYFVSVLIYFEADENGNYIWKDCKKKKSHVFGTQISFVTLWEIATKLKQNKESTPLWVNWTFFFSKYDTYLVHAHFVPFYIAISIQSPFLLNYICVAFSHIIDVTIKLFHVSEEI